MPRPKRKAAPPITSSDVDSSLRTGTSISRFRLVLPRENRITIFTKRTMNIENFNCFFLVVFLWGNEFFCGEVPKLANLIDLCADRGQVFVIGPCFPVVKLWVRYSI